MSLVQQRNNIVEALKAIPGVRTVQTHGGRFDLAELKRVSTQSPALLIACLSLPGIDDRHGTLDVHWGIFIVARSNAREKRDEIALALAQRVLDLVRGNDWDVDAQRPTRLRADNLFNTTVDKQGVALWAVSFQQKLNVADVDISSLDDFLRAHVTYGDHTNPAAIDHIKLEQNDA